MIQDDEEHGEGAEEDGEGVEVVVGYHCDGLGGEFLERGVRGERWSVGGGAG